MALVVKEGQDASSQIYALLGVWDLEYHSTLHISEFSCLCAAPELPIDCPE